MLNENYYVLKIIANTNPVMEFAKGHEPVGKYCLLHNPAYHSAWVPGPTMSWSSKLNNATYFSSHRRAESAIKNYGPLGFVFEIISLQIKGSAVGPCIEKT